MTGWAGFGAVTGASLLFLVVLQSVTYIIGRRLGRYNVVDVIWGFGFVGVGWIAFAVGGGDLTRRLILALAVTIWGLRLTWHMYGKSKGKGEDPRYQKLLGEDPSAWTVIRKIFLTQGAAQWFVSLPLQVSAVVGATTGVWWIVLGAGVVIWVVGLLFEAVGDAQMTAFKADPSNKGTIMDRGLWAWTRHPNYFGDSSVWWGMWLIAASAWPGVLTVLSPVVMTYFLVFATGARLLEESMSKRPGYPAYQQRTSYFLPRPPKHTGASGRSQ
ncbi:DUF1295 domain-containing protein [Gordonia sp. NPDC003429]